MKRFVAIALVLILALSLVACGNTETKPQGPTKEQINAKSEGVMTYAQYDAAALETEVTIEAYVQATQSWWDNKITVYTQDADGAYFIYELACSEDNAKKLTPGTKIRVTGYKKAWEGEVEIMDATFEFVTSDIKYIADPVDVTSLLGTEDLIKKQNQKVAFKGLTIEAINYRNGAPGDDIYVTVSKDGQSYDFCVELYLTGPDTAVYKAFADLKAGDKVDMEGFLYWYQGVNTHITAVTKK